MPGTRRLAQALTRGKLLFLQQFSIKTAVGGQFRPVDGSTVILNTRVLVRCTIFVVRLCLREGLDDG